MNTTVIRRLLPLASAALAAAALTACAWSPPGDTAPIPEGVTLDGEWESDWGHMVLKHEGGRVSGTFSHGMGTLDGTVVQDAVQFSWVQPGDEELERREISGKGWWRVVAGGDRLEGRYGLGNAWDDGGDWNGHRPGKAKVEAAPEPAAAATGEGEESP
jgi:hypothetical protein